MSEFHVEVVEVKNVKKHPNADSLSVGEVNGYPVIFRTGEFEEGALAGYAPVDSIFPDLPKYQFLGSNRRIKAKRLRGIFSMGLLVPCRPEWELGQNIQEELGITKWEPTIPVNMQGDNASDKGVLPVYTDIEGFRRFPDVLIEGGEVVLTEKTHGVNFRACFHDNELIVGSHHTIKKIQGTEFLSVWSKVALKLELDKKLAAFPDIAIYGEVFGPVQDLTYGRKNADLVLFDAMDLKTFEYLDYDAFLELASKLQLPTVPLLFRGAWNKELLAFSEGPTAYPGANHIREGFVVRPAKERRDLFIGRVILKMVGEGYLLRKESKVPASCNHLKKYSET